MTARKILLFLSSCCLLTFQNAQAVTIQQYLPGLLESHERIKAAQGHTRSAEHLVRQYRAGYLPSVDFTTETGYENIHRENGTDTEHGDKTYNRLRATQLLWDFGATSGRVYKTESFLRQVTLQEEAVRQEVLLEGILACVAVIRERDRLSYAVRSENNIKKQTGIEETLLEKGAGIKSDVLQAKSQLAAAMALRMEIEGELEIAKNRFQTLFGRTISEEEINALELTARYRDLVPVTLEESVQTALQTNPSLLAKALDRDIADHEITARKAAYYPRLELIGQGKYRYNDDGLDGERTDLFVGVGLTYNIYRGGGDSSAVEAAVAERNSFALEFEEQKNLVIEEVRNTWQTLVTAEAKQEVLSNQALIAVRFLELARKEREMGNRTLLEVLSAEVEYYRAMSNAIAAQAEANGAIFGLLKAIGILTLEQLTEVNPS
ncbi:MAG: TolC family outer membrane protein [Desulfobulbaceae bacterium]